MSRMSPISKCAIAVACILLSACEAQERKLQCTDPIMTAECGRLLSACQSERRAADGGNAKSASQLMTACLRRSYETRCNAMCQIAE